MIKVRIQAVMERFAFAAAQDLEVFQTHEFFQASAKAFVGPAEVLSELAACPVDVGGRETGVARDHVLNLPSARVDEFAAEAAEFIEGDPEDSER